jgi:hypothetical protein
MTALLALFSLLAPLPPTHAPSACLAGPRAPVAEHRDARAAPPQASDVKLVGAVLRRFLRSKGRTLRGRQVVWNVPASVFDRAQRRRGDHALFVHKGIGIVVRVQEPALGRLRRRGGVARLRGRVHAAPRRAGPAPAKGGKKTGPEHYIAVRSLKARRR